MSLGPAGPFLKRKLVPDAILDCMKFNVNVLVCCLTALLIVGGSIFALQSLQATILVAADKMSPKLQPTSHQVTVDGSVSIGNRKGSNLDVGVTMGK